MLRASKEEGGVPKPHMAGLMGALPGEGEAPALGPAASTPPCPFSAAAPPLAGRLWPAHPPLGRGWGLEAASVSLSLSGETKLGGDETGVLVRRGAEGWPRLRLLRDHQVGTCRQWPREDGRAGGRLEGSALPPPPSDQGVWLGTPVPLQLLWPRP